MTRGMVVRRLARVRADVDNSAQTTRTLHVHSDGELADALRAASWWNTSRRKRLEIVLTAGTYHQQVELLDGIDLTGPGYITWDGRGDTILTHGADTTLTGITVTNTGPGGYAIHADAPCPRSALRLTRVTAHADESPALGAGLFGGQTIHAVGSTFTSGAYAAVVIHPWLNQQQPAVATFTECHAASPHAGIVWNQLASGQPDALHWTGTIDAPTPLDAETLPPVLAFA